MKPTDIPIYVRPEISLNIMNENQVQTSPGWHLSHNKSNLNIDHLSLKMTTHRLQIFHPVHKETFNYEIFFEKIQGYQLLEEGSMCCTRTAVLEVKTLGGEVYSISKMGEADISQFGVGFEKVYKGRKWKQKRVVSKEHMKNNFRLGN